MDNNVCDMSATQLSEAIHSKRISCVTVMKACLDRIARYNARVNAIVDLAPREDLLALAALHDSASKIPRDKPLYGIPFAVKDLYDAKGFVTSQGHLGFADKRASGDNDFVKCIRRAGAIIIGKTNTPEFGTGSHTFNAVYGITRNPFDLSRVSGGSSGGASAALASSFLPLADGSDYAGSLRNPASFCGVVGFRPTVPDHKETPVKCGDWEQATIGPMARTVEDVALLWGVMTNRPPLSPPLHSREAFKWGTKDRVAFLGDCGARIPIEASVLTQVDRLVPLMEQLAPPGGVERTFPAFLKDAFEAFLVLRHADYAANHRSRNQLQVKGAIRWDVEQGQSLSSNEVACALKTRALLRKQIDAWMETYRFFVLPSAQCIPFHVSTEWPEEVAGVRMTSYLNWMQVCCEITLLGLPVVSLPCGIDPATQMPVGAQIVGRRGADEELLRLSHALEVCRGRVVNFPREIGLDASAKKKGGKK